jgi:cell division septation protein DedD
LLYVPSDAPGHEAVLARADGIVVLRREDETLALGEAEARLLATFGPAASGAAGGASSGAGPSDAGRPAAAGATPGPGPAAEDTGAARARQPAADRSGRRRGCLRLVVMMMLLAALALILVAAMGWIRLPLLGPQAASATLISSRGAVPPEAAEILVTRVQERPVGAPVQAWALALEAHLDGATARARVEALSERWSDLLFWVAPVRVRDDRYHRVLAGPATTADEVEALRARLGGDASWIARHAGLAFQLGALPDLEGARTWSGVLADLGIPTHVLEVPGPDGSLSYHVYAGAYASEAEAAELAEILREQDMGAAPLTERRGRPPA